MKIHIYLSIFAIFAFAFCSCEKENLPPNKTKYSSDKEYFPLKTGTTFTYKVTAITINKPSEYYDTSVYYLKEHIGEQFLDNENDTAYKIQRSKAENLYSNWQITDIWEAKLTDNTAEKVEENQRFIKLSFPIKKDIIWNYNRKNNLPKLEVCINATNDYYLLDNKQIDSCINVRWNNSDSIINLRVKNEKYARNIGLVYKDSIDIYSDEVIIGVPIMQRITRGTIYYQELIRIDQNTNY